MFSELHFRPDTILAMNTDELELKSWAEKVEDQLQELAKGVAPKARNKADRLAALKPAILRLRAQGFSYEQIAPLLGKVEGPIEISGPALRRKMAKKRRKKKETTETGGASTG